MGDGRRERGRLLAEDGRIKHLDGGLWWVPSSTSGGYIVDVATAAPTCSCQDHAKLPTGAKCKHIFAVELRRSAEAAPDTAPALVSVAPKPSKPVLRGDLTAEEQRHVRAALRFQRTRAAAGTRSRRASGSSVGR